MYTSSNGRERPSKNVLRSFSAQLDKRMSLADNMKWLTAAEYNSDTVSDAAKDILKILLPLCKK